MKKILLVFVLSIFITAQENQTLSLIDLKSQIKINTDLLESPENEEDQVIKKKSVPMAILYSFLLPGMGELYAGSYNSGKYFTIAEGTLWVTYAGVSYYSSWQKDNYKAFAVNKGGVVLEGKDEDYFANIGNYTSVYSFNKEKLLSRDYESAYNEVNDYWSWSDDNLRKEYRSMWRSSEQAKNNLRFVVGAMIINRVISAINAARIVASRNKEIEQMSWNISVGTVECPDNSKGLSLNFVQTF